VIYLAFDQAAQRLRRRFGSGDDAAPSVPGNPA